MPIRLFPLWVAQELLDDPSNPSSLRAMVDGPVPVLGNATLDFDLANRLLSLAGGASFFSEEIASVDSFVAANGPLSFLTTRTSPGKASVSVVAGGCIEGGDYGIDDAGSLDKAMWAARFAINRLDGASGEYVDDLGNFVAIMGVIPELKPLATAVGGALFVYKAMNQAAGAVLPSSFDNTATDFEIQDKTEFFEDDEGGNWAKFKVTAVSRGLEDGPIHLGIHRDHRRLRGSRWIRHRLRRGWVSWRQTSPSLPSTRRCPKRSVRRPTDRTSWRSVPECGPISTSPIPCTPKRAFLWELPSSSSIPPSSKSRSRGTPRFASKPSRAPLGAHRRPSNRNRSKSCSST